MAKRITIKEGDIFKIVDINHYRYFQFFYTEINNLNANLIWIFKCKENTNDLDKIVNSGYDFYLYTYINIGIKLGLFEKIGTATIPKSMNYIPKFRWTDNDLRHKIKDWYIVQGDKKIYVGENLSNEEKQLPFISVNFPKGAVEDMILGYKSFMKIN